MRQELSLLILFVFAWGGGCTQQTVNGQIQPGELAEFDTSRLGQSTWRELRLHGLHIGTPVLEIEKQSKLHTVFPERLSPESVSFFQADSPGRELSTGVTVFLKEDRISWIRLGLRTRMSNVDAPQTTYIQRMSLGLRQFFENYTDSTRIQVFGDVEKKARSDGNRFRDYIYDYPSRGIALEVFAFREHDGWKEELAYFYIYDPTDIKPGDLKLSGN